MSKLKLVDFIKINPDPSYATLSRKDKIGVIDSLFSRADDKKGLYVTYDLSHSGRRINNRIYTVAGQQAGIQSLLNPYPKPIIRNHDEQNEPIGRFVSGYWDDTSEEAIGFFDNVNDYMNVQSAFDADDPERIYKAMKKYGLLTRKSWPGLGRMRVTARISEQDAIEKFLDGRYITFSAGSTTDRHVCSVCLNDWALGDMCEHRHGNIYDNDLCVFVTGKFEVLEGSVVNMPADDLSQVLSMELSDSVQIQDLSTIKVDKHTVYLTDSMYSIKDNTNIGASLEDVKDIESKEYDHMLDISEQAMKTLHSSGEAEIITKSGKEEIKIKLTYDNDVKSSVSDDSLSVLQSLQKKAAKHNSNCAESNKIEFNTLTTVYDRGMKSFPKSKSNIYIKRGWAMARVNAFLTLAKEGKPSNPKYTVDNDLLPAGHTMKSKGRE
jgi:hypothetical protein